jgi:hypothetical protein
MLAIPFNFPIHHFQKKKPRHLLAHVKIEGGRNFSSDTEQQRIIAKFFGAILTS